jgi:hypothetical protein
MNNVFYLAVLLHVAYFITMIIWWVQPTRQAYAVMMTITLTGFALVIGVWVNHGWFIALGVAATQMIAGLTFTQVTGGYRRMHDACLKASFRMMSK